MSNSRIPDRGRAHAGRITAALVGIPWSAGGPLPIGHGRLPDLLADGPRPPGEEFGRSGTGAVSS